MRAWIQKKNGRSRAVAGRAHGVHSSVLTNTHVDSKKKRSVARRKNGRSRDAGTRARARDGRVAYDSRFERPAFVRSPGRAFAVRLFLKDARTRDAGSRARAAVADFQSFNL
jgi:hypothetical protein